MTDSTPKLEKGMTLFTFTNEGKAFHLKSMFPYWIYPQHADAFKLAADMVIDSHERSKRSPNNDHLLFPVLYLYRHCIELKLKDLVLIGIKCGVFTNEEVKKPLNGHYLTPLWEAVSVMLKKYNLVDEQSEIAGSLIEEFQQIDADGHTLRYDRNKDLKHRQYEQIPEYISILDIRMKMDRLYNYLDYTYGAIADWWDAGRHS